MLIQKSVVNISNVFDLSLKRPVRALGLHPCDKKWVTHSLIPIFDWLFKITLSESFMMGRHFQG